VALVREEDAAEAAGTAQELDVAVARDYHPAVGSLVFRLLGTPAAAFGEPATVTAIEVRDGDLPAVRQILGPFEARVRLDPYAGASDPYGGFFIEDLDFDGFPDLRLEAREATPEGEAEALDAVDGESAPEGTSSVEVNVPFLYWRYDATAGRFVQDEALSAVVSPEVDATERVIRSAWRVDAGDTGTDTWAWQEGELIRVARERRYLREDGETVTQYYRRDGEAGELEQVEEIVAGEAPER
jgi:hypothetical protein